jgi:hypothetical protein
MSRLLIAVAIFMVPHSALFARTDVNSEYGFRARTPSWRTVCTTANDGSTADRGFSVLWDAPGCRNTDDASGIYVYFDMNAFDSLSTLDLGKHICDGNAIRPSPFWVSGFHFFHCKSKTDGGRVGLDYFVLRHVKGGYAEGEQTYGVTLICPHDDCRKLMPMTRWIFEHMKFIIQK